MDTVLKNLIGTDFFIFIYDLIIYSRPAEEHALRVENVLHRLEQVNLQLHPGKCDFVKSQVQYLGYILPEKGISACPENLKLYASTPPQVC